MSEMTSQSEKTPPHVVDDKYHIGAPSMKVRGTLFIWSGGVCTYQSWLVFVCYGKSWLPIAIPFSQKIDRSDGSRQALHFDDVLRKLVEKAPGACNGHMRVRLAPTSIDMRDPIKTKVLTLKYHEKFFGLTYDLGYVPTTIRSTETDALTGTVIMLNDHQSTDPADAVAEQTEVPKPAEILETIKQENPANAEVTKTKEVIMSNEKNEAQEKVGTDVPAPKSTEQTQTAPTLPAYTCWKQDGNIHIKDLRSDVVMVEFSLTTGEYKTKQVGEPFKVAVTELIPVIFANSGHVVLENVLERFVPLKKEVNPDDVIYIGIKPMLNSGSLAPEYLDIRGVELEKLGIKVQPPQQLPVSPAPAIPLVTVPQVVQELPPQPEPVALPTPKPTPAPVVKTAEEMVLDKQEARIARIVADLEEIPSNGKYDPKQLEDMIDALAGGIPKALEGITGERVTKIMDKCDEIAQHVEKIQARQSHLWPHIDDIVTEVGQTLKAITAEKGHSDTDLEDAFSAFAADVESRNSTSPSMVSDLLEHAKHLSKVFKQKLAELKAAKAAADKAAAEQAEKLANEEAAKAEAEQKQAEELEKLAAENAAKDEANKALAEQLAHAKADKAQAEAVAQQEREAAEKLRKRVAELEVLKKEVVDEPLPPPPNVSPTAPPASAGGAEGNRVGSGNRSSRLTSWVIGFLIVLTLAQGAWFLLRTKETVEMTVPPLGDEAREEIRQKMLSDTSTNSNMPRLKGVIPNSRQPSTDTAALSQESSLMIGIISEDVKNYGKVTEQTLPLIEALVAQNRVLQVSTNTAASATSGSIKVNESGKNNAGSAGGNGNANGSGTQVIQNNQYHPEYHIYLGRTNVAAPIAAPPTPPPAPKAKEGVKGDMSCDDGDLLQVPTNAVRNPDGSYSWVTVLHPGDPTFEYRASPSKYVVTYKYLCTTDWSQMQIHAIDLQGRLVPLANGAHGCALPEGTLGHQYTLKAGGAGTVEISFRISLK